MSEPIEGLRFIVSGAEMVNHLEAKSQDHGEKADRYQQQLDSLPREDGPVQTMDPRQSLGQKVSEHRRKERLFEFMAAHLSTFEDYSVDEQDLARVEWIDRF